MIGCVWSAVGSEPPDLESPEGKDEIRWSTNTSAFAKTYMASVFRLTLRSPRERWQSLGKRSGEVGGGLEGSCTPVAVDFMLPFLGSAAAGGKEVRGSRHASEEGPVREKKKDFGSHLSSYNTDTTPN